MRKKQLCTHGNVSDESQWDKSEGNEPSVGKSLMSKNAFVGGETPLEKSIQLEVVKDPAKGRRLVVNVQKRIGFTEKETKRHISACALTEVIINSLEFKNKVLAFKFDTTKKTSRQVYDHIMTGEEVLQKGVDYEMDVIVEMYYKLNNVVGYTYPSVIQTWLNRRVTANYTDADIAGNLVHEWLHKLGYGHASASDHDSVPYAIGYMVSAMAKQYKAGKLKLTDLYPNKPEAAPEVPSETPVIPIPVIPTADPAVPATTPEPIKVCERKWYYLWLGKECYYKKV